MSETNLMPIFLSFGEVHQFRLMVTYSGYNRGFGYLSYESEYDPYVIVNFLNDFEFHTGQRLRATISSNECRLYVSNIPISVMNFEVEQLVRSVTNPSEVIYFELF